MRRQPLHPLVIAAAGMMLALIILPVMIFSVRALFSAGPTKLAGESLVSAIRISLITTAISLGCTIIFGTPLAYVFARYTFPLKRVLNTLIELPVVMPPVVAGLALLVTFGRRGPFGLPFASLGISVPFTIIAVVLAQLFVSSPYYIRAAQMRFEAIPRELEQAASIDGAGRWQMFWNITLPLSSRGLLAGAVLSWARALGEFGATILFAGSLQGRTQTMPLFVYSALEQDLNAASWAGLILIVLAALAFGVAWWLSRSLGEEPDPLAEM